MPVTVNCLVNVQVVDGPKLSASQTLELEAYDFIEVDVEPGDSEIEVEVQPGSGTGVGLLMVRATAPSADLSYSVNDTEANGATRFALDSAHLLVGAGAIGFLGASPESLFLYNDGAARGTVAILVGRDATP